MIEQHAARDKRSSRKCKTKPMEFSRKSFVFKTSNGTNAYRYAWQNFLAVLAHAAVARFAHGSESKFTPGGNLVVGNHSSRLTFDTITKQEIRMSSTCSVPPRELVSVEVAAQQVGAHPSDLVDQVHVSGAYPVRHRKGPQMANPRPTPKPSIFGPRSPGPRFRCIIRCLHRKGAPDGKPTPNAET